jgi:uncharacterized protein (DUF2267 family)
MILDFEKYAMKGNEFLNKLSANLGNVDRSHAARILKNTFRVLRNHITPEESLQLISQLPMALKSIYVDGWKLSDHKRVKNIDEFLVEIIQAEGQDAWRDFSSKDEVLNAVKAVIDTMRLYVSHEEIDQALGTLPKKVRDNFEAFNY